jgi:hypothetical protein
MRPSPALVTWLPYRNDCSALGFTQILHLAYWASRSKAVMCSRNLPPPVNLPMHVPTESRLSRATFVLFNMTSSLM